MTYPATFKYTKDHEWVDVSGDRGKVGITDYAQQQLGDIVYVELPEVGEDPIVKDAPFAVVESVKAVSDVYAPISGLITEVNDELPNSPEVINEDCYGDGWMIRMRPTNPDELDELLSAEDYEQLINEIA